VCVPKTSSRQQHYNAAPEVTQSFTVASVGFATSQFCFFNAVHELVLWMIARCFAFGHETLEQRQIVRTSRRCDAGPGRLA
jgi:hypothetical protein